MTTDVGDQEPRIRLAHGGGGLLMRELVREVFAATFAPDGAASVLEDAALLDVEPGARLAFTTDTFVVDPIFFPGGDLGDLAVNGTVNDLAARGARPVAISVAMVLEEGLPVAVLRRVVESIGRAAERCGVRVATGDTKVVARGQADKLFVNTSGVGFVAEGVDVGASNLRPGDRLIVSGPIGDHGIAVMSRRAGLSFEADVVSDTAPLADLVAAMLEAAPGAVHALRDPTRGGLAAALVELAEDSKVGAVIDETALPVRPAVRAACETLGLDPMHVPCEGRLLIAVAPEAQPAVLEVLRGRVEGEDSAVIGEAVAADRPEVSLRTRVGGLRGVDLPSGELLPRIC